jgi:hypothetical protein
MVENIEVATGDAKNFTHILLVDKNPSLLMYYNATLVRILLGQQPG